MRKALIESNIPTVKFKKVGIEDDLDFTKEMNFPLIVKPTDRSGSRAITKITDKTELKEAISKAIDNSFEKKAIVEEFIEGREYSAEGISFNGKHRFLTITEKQTTGAPHFIETGHIEPAFISNETKERVYKELEKALDALEITNSATHSEFKITPNNEVRIIEIGARMGGDCIGSDLVKLSTGYDYIKMVIDVAMGNEPNLDIGEKYNYSAIKFIFNEKDLDDLKKAQEIIPDCIFRVSEIDEIGTHEVVDSSSRYGFYILKTNDFDQIGWLFNNG